MFCTKCGKELLDDARFCPACGTLAGASAQTSVVPAQQAVKKYRYAGFWIRFLAHSIDQLVISVVLFMFVIIGIVFSIGSLTALSDFPDMDDPDPALIASLIGGWIIFGIVATIAQWLYYAFMESSASRGTLGKMALGLQVIDYKGETVSFARATGRYFAKILSGMILMIGYIMAGVTAKKQALHDLLCDTYVVRQRDTLDYE